MREASGPVPHETGELKPLSWYRDLHESKGRRSSGFFLIEGERAVGFIRDNRPELLREVLESENCPFPTPRTTTHRSLTRSQLKSIALTKQPSGPLGVIAIPGESYSSTLSTAPGHLIVVLEDIQDPGNVGSLLRTAAALGFSGAILSDKCADPFSPKAAQASAGSVVSLWIRRSPDYLEMIRDLKGRGFKCVGTAVGGTCIFPAQAQESVLLVLGNEGNGLTDRMRAVCDDFYGIPLDSHKAESLNVAAAGAISMFAALQRNT